MNYIPRNYRFYIGTYSDRGGQGVYRAEFDGETGRLSHLQPACVLPNASYQAIHPCGRWIYSVCENREDGRRRNGSICAMAIDPGSGDLRLLNRRRSIGDGPCHVCLSNSGRYAFVSNYAGGSVVIYPILSNGSLGNEPTAFIQHQGGSGVVSDRQEGPHAHSMTLSPDNRYVFAADLGQDRIRVYTFEEKNGTLLPAKTPEVMCDPGSGPRHMVMHPDGRTLYLVHELNSTVAIFDYVPERGMLLIKQTVSTLPEEWKGASFAADIQITSDGRFLYASNRGHDSLVVCTIDNKTGMIRTRGFVPVRGHWPRQFRLTPDGRYLIVANQGSDTLTVFLINPENGDLTPVSEPFPVPSPVCVTFRAGF